MRHATRGFARGYTQQAIRSHFWTPERPDRLQKWYQKSKEVRRIAFRAHFQPYCPRLARLPGESAADLAWLHRKH